MNTQSSSAALSSLLDQSGLIVYAHPSKLNETRTSAQNVSCSHPPCYTILHRPWHWADRGQSAAHATTHRLAQGPVHSHPGLGIRGINTSINCTDCPRSQGQLLSPLFANIAGAANSKARIQQAALGVPSGNRGAEKRTVVLWRDSQYCWEARAKWVTSLFTRKPAKSAFYTVGRRACLLFWDKEQYCLLTGTQKKLTLRPEKSSKGELFSVH